MTKVLLLLRHAQTAGRQGGQTDYDRHLTPQGEDTSRNLGLLILKHQLRPDYVLSSSAARTKQTVEYINKNLQLPTTNLLLLNELYEGSANRWIDQIHKLPPTVNCALLAGHNPALSQLASTFAQRSIDLPSGGLIAFEFLTEQWSEISGPGKEIARIMGQG